jgi:hypothetical protein
MWRIIISLIAACWASVAFGQASVQQVVTRLDVASNVGFTQAGVGSSSVVTITPPGGGFYVYLTGIGIDVCESGTGTAITNGNVTSSGIVGTPSWSFSNPANINTCAFGNNSGGPVGQGYPATTVSEKFAVPLRSSTPGTAVVLTSPTTANVQYTIRAYYYFAP